MTDWTEEPIDLSVWKRVPGHPFADYDPADGIALWSLWEMPSTAVGKVVRRGPARAGQEPTVARSVRLPVSTWKRLEEEAEEENTSVSAVIRKRLGYSGLSHAHRAKGLGFGGAIHRVAQRYCSTCST